MKLGNEAVQGMPKEVREAMEIVAAHLGFGKDSDWALKCQASLDCKTQVPHWVAAEYARMAQIAMVIYGNEDMASAAIAQAFCVGGELLESRATVNTHVSRVLKLRTANELERRGIETIGELIAWTAQELMQIENFSWKVVSDLRKDLKRHDFRLMGECD